MEISRKVRKNHNSKTTKISLHINEDTPRHIGTYFLRRQLTGHVVYKLYSNKWRYIYNFRSNCENYQTNRQETNISLTIFWRIHLLPFCFANLAAIASILVTSISRLSGQQHTINMFRVYRWWLSLYIRKTICVFVILHIKSFSA